MNELVTIANAGVEEHPETERLRLAEVVRECWMRNRIRDEEASDLSRARLDDAIAGGEALVKLRTQTKWPRGTWMPWVEENIRFSHNKVNDWMLIWTYRKDIPDVGNIGEALTVIRKLRSKERRQRLRDNPISLPPGKFSVIVADPPWEVEGVEYNTMTIDEICDLKVASVAADDAVLWLWRVASLDREAHAVLDAWGFTYSGRKLVWVKDKANGQHPWMAGKHEDCLIARRGKPVIFSGQVDVLAAPRRRHSEKPQEAFELIDAMCPAGHGHKLELFARPDDRGRYARAEQGWVPYGDEVARWVSKPAAA